MTQHIRNRWLTVLAFEAILVGCGGGGGGVLAEGDDGSDTASSSPGAPPSGSGAPGTSAPTSSAGSSSGATPPSNGPSLSDTSSPEPPLQPSKSPKEQSGDGINLGQNPHELPGGGIDFGVVPIGGTSKPRTITVHNQVSDGAPVTIISVTVSPGAFKRYSDGCSGRRLEFLDTCTVQVVFSPEGPGLDHEHVGSVVVGYGGEFPGKATLRGRTQAKRPSLAPGTHGSGGATAAPGSRSQSPSPTPATTAPLDPSSSPPVAR